MAIPGRGLSAVDLSDFSDPTELRTSSVGFEQRLLSDAASAQPALSPDGSRVAFLADEGAGAEVFISATTLWGPRRITRADHPAVSVSWSADGSLLGFATTPAGGARTQLHVVDSDGRSQRPMFVAHGESALPGTWTRSGRSYAFSTALGGVGESRSSYVLDLAESTLVPLARTSAEDGHIDVDDLTADRNLALLRLGQGSARRTVLLDRATGRRSALPVADADARFTADGSGVVFRDRRPDGTGFLAGCSTAGAVAGSVAALPGTGVDDLDGLAFSGDRSVALLSAAQEDGSHRLILWRPATGGSWPVPLPGDRLVVLAASLDAAGARAVVELSGPELPPSLWVLDVATLDLTRLDLTVRDTGDQASGGNGTAVRARFPAPAGAELSGHLFRPDTPAGAGAGPTVLLLPVAPDEVDRQHYRPLIPELLTMGIRVFRLIARRPAGGTSPDVTDATDDALAAARYLIDTGIAHPDQLGIWGAGFGGFLTLSATARAPELFAAAVDVGGVAGLETYAASVPTLVVHGGADSTVPLSESEQVVESLRRTGAEVEALFLPGQGNALTTRSAQRDVIPAVVDWFLRLLTRSRSDERTLSTSTHVGDLEGGGE
ncbi:MAG TPA: prolyl oligopeptidase family serine peptidase [Frankiaceae bacterium]|nr:prolyl oligopeptidase family serine peptidase [Frankiaceae bacterium]